MLFVTVRFFLDSFTVVHYISPEVAELPHLRSATVEIILALVVPIFLYW